MFPYLSMSKTKKPKAGQGFSTDERWAQPSSCFPRQQGRNMKQRAAFQREGMSTFANNFCSAEMLHSKTH